MKKFIVLALCGFSSAAFAGGQQQTATQSQAANSVSAASTDGNSQSVTYVSPSTLSETVNGSTTIKNVPTVNAPALTTSNDTCMGSTSGSITIAGFGLGAGTAWTDKNCVMLKNSRELWNMGMKAAALARMCMDSNNKDSLELTGFECPQTKKAREDREAKERTAYNAANSTGVLKK